MNLSKKSMAGAGAVGICVLMVASFAVAAKSKPTPVRPRRRSVAATTVSTTVEDSLVGAPPKEQNARLGQMQKRAATSASRLISAGNRQSRYKGGE